MSDEWYSVGEKIIPYAFRKNDYHNLDFCLENLEVNSVSNGQVPVITFGGMNTERDIFIGAVNIHHYLNEELLLRVGYIGDGVRSSERVQQS